MGASLVGFFGVYHRLLGVRLRQAASSGNQAELERLAREMAEGASRSQHAYVHAQQVLTELAGDAGPWASRFRRLSQEIEASVPGPAVWKMQRWFAPPGDAATAAAALVSDILAVAAGGNLAPSADVIKLARLYNAPSLSSEGCLVPPVSIVRHPRLIEVLLQGLFTAGKQLQEEAQAAHISVLAMAVAAQDVDGQDLPPLENQPAVVAARQALRTTSAAAHKALREELLTDEEREEVEAALAERCCGVGVMRMLRSRITSPSYWTSVVHLHKEAPYVPLLHAAVRQQPKMLSDIFSLVRDALSAAGHSGRGSDVVVGLMKVAVAVALAGRLEDVLKWADQWARGADAPLVRQFVYGIFEGAAPPYSPFFAAAMLRLLVAAGGRKAIGTRELAGRAPLLSEFVEGCRQVKFETPLSPSESTCLKDLESALRVNHKK